MRPPFDLLDRWHAALVFNVCGRSNEVSCLPDPSSWPARLPAPQRAFTLGRVLGYAILKLACPTAADRPHGWGAQASAGVLLERCWAQVAFDGLDWQGDVAFAADRVVGDALRLAFSSPDRLLELRRRVDALTDETLRQWAMAAVKGEFVSDLFVGLSIGRRSEGASSLSTAGMSRCADLIDPSALAMVLPACVAAIESATWER
ncbi:hypothetical protein OPU71_07030 [Niveibacterium sp. 24ML]|uniref:hypothetical protein n=1 Tax=Niveibacterium sp. 24ML TaxID=2985512 RepID=UPI0022716D8E|nr:hypothetical protein [Niveibacterium sp. 24ML]MCX9155881.1 hypothetical protein [Niveibacterium sp. 24ML]